jgi:glucokinase
MVAGGATPYGVHRTATEGLGRYPGAPAAELQRRVLEQLETELAAALAAPGASGVRAVGLSFAGPTTAGGVALAAPTMWGDCGVPVPISERLGARLGLPVLTVNDLTAAAWRYASPANDAFGLFTVSSGIGGKIFRRGQVLIDDDGFGGELGHWRVDHSAAAPRCDCGGRGHLGGISSGRGVLRAVRSAALEDPEQFAGSALAEPAGGRPAAITNEAIAAAVRAGDPFSVRVLHTALRPLAMAVAGVFAAIGIRRYLFIGGFAVAVGERFVEILGDEVVEQGCFGLAPAEIRAMLALGADDDDHSLIGLGKMLAAVHPSRRPEKEAAYANADSR